MAEAALVVVAAHGFGTRWLNLIIQHDKHSFSVYASTCWETGRPVSRPGSRAQWEGLSDVTDARVLAKQLVWAATSAAAHKEACNIVSG